MTQPTDHFVREQDTADMRFITVSSPVTTLFVHDVGGGGAGPFQLRINSDNSDPTTTFASYNTKAEAEAALLALVQDLGEIHTLPAD